MRIRTYAYVRIHVRMYMYTDVRICIQIRDLLRAITRNAYVH